MSIFPCLFLRVFTMHDTLIQRSLSTAKYSSKIHWPNFFKTSFKLMLHCVTRNTFLLLIQGPVWITRHTWSCIDCIQGLSVLAAEVISQTDCPLGWRIFMPFLPTAECLHVLKWYSLAYLQQLYGAVITARGWMSIYKIWYMTLYGLNVKCWCAMFFVGLRTANTRLRIIVLLQSHGSIRRSRYLASSTADVAA